MESLYNTYYGVSHDKLHIYLLQLHVSTLATLTSTQPALGDIPPGSPIYMSRGQLGRICIRSPIRPVMVQEGFIFNTLCISCML